MTDIVRFFEAKRLAQSALDAGRAGRDFIIPQGKSGAILGEMYDRGQRERDAGFVPQSCLVRGDVRKGQPCLTT